MYKVPSDKRCQLTYFRAGNSSNELVYFLVKRDDTPMRYFPVGAKSAIHIALAVTEDLHPDTTLEVQLAAPAGTVGEVVIDVGLVEF
jgi:assimilatory nitrate reductase catalytic subunit